VQLKMEGDQHELLQMEFEGVEAQDSDIASMARLLNQLVRESGVDPDQLAKVLVSQNYIGSVLKPAIDDMDLDDNEDPEDQPAFAIHSIVNITHRQEPVIQDVFKFLRKYIRDLKVKVEKGNKIFEELISDNKMSEAMTVGLLIKERMVNMPMALLHPSLLSLMSDIDKAAKVNMPYKFTHLLYWSKMYINEGEFCHYDAEDAWFEENSLEHFSYPLKFADTVMVKSDEPKEVGATPIRRVYVIEFAKIHSFIEHLQTVSVV